MLRDRLLCRRWLVHLIVAWGFTIAALPHVADAAPFPPTRDGASEASLDAVRAVLEQKIIRGRLAALGVSPAEAEAALQRLSPEERTELAARAQELAAGGNAVALLAVAIILGLLVIFALELMGRRVISRP